MSLKSWPRRVSRWFWMVLAAAAAFLSASEVVAFSTVVFIPHLMRSLNVARTLPGAYWLTRFLTQTVVPFKAMRLVYERMWNEQSYAFLALGAAGVFGLFVSSLRRLNRRFDLTRSQFPPF